MKKEENILQQKRWLTRFIKGIYFKQDIDLLKKNISESKDLRMCLSKQMDVEFEKQDNHTSFEERIQYEKEATQLLKRINKKESRGLLIPFSLLRYAAVAAIIIFVLLSPFYLFYLPTKSIDFITLYTGQSERKKIVLEDGSLIYLNANSTLIYPKKFNIQDRTITIHGEAYLKVQRDSKRPFFVKSTHLSTKVLGTSFNIRAYEDDSNSYIYVEEGCVQVSNELVSVRLQANDLFFYNQKEKTFKKERETHANITGWVSKKSLYFNATPIESVIKELKRQYNCSIELAPNTIFDELIYGEHENKSLESVLNAIAYSTNIKYKYTKGGTIILYK